MTVGASRGVVSAGHPLTAEAGARVLREGGNAVDAVVAASLASFACESPLTGFGAGGYMLVCPPGRPEAAEVIDFFVEAGGRDRADRTVELLPVEVDFDGTPQIFNIGPASCGVPGNAVGLSLALERHGSMPMADLAAPAAAMARDGVVISAGQAYLFELLTGVLMRYPEAKRLYAPEGRMLDEGELFRFPDLADALERFGAEGPAPFVDGDIAAAIADEISQMGGRMSKTDFAEYQAGVRAPVGASFGGNDLITNPPPSAGGVLLAYAIELLGRAGRFDIETVVGAMAAAQAARNEDFHGQLETIDCAARLLDDKTLDETAARLAADPSVFATAAGQTRPADDLDRLGSTTHITVVDADGGCASLTCSNGTGSGIVVPGTGVHLNNMLGEQDLNPFGYHRYRPGQHLSSMMSPTAVFRDGELCLALGSGGSNRIRSAILQVVLAATVGGLGVDEAVRAPRVHFEDGIVQAEPGVDPAGLESLERAGTPVARWNRTNWFFGGVHAASRDVGSADVPAALAGGGDPRRGGAVAFA